MTDGQARNVQQYEYDSFGNQHDMKNRIKQPYGYTGREHDRETGLRYYRARYYDGEVGVFLSKDPISFLSGDTNLYRYVRGNPVKFIDPYGLWELEFPLIYNFIDRPEYTGDALSDPNLALNFLPAGTTVGKLPKHLLSKGVCSKAAGELSAEQLANLKRYAKKLPSKAGPIKIHDLPGGGKAFVSDVPANNIPGSYATYQKQVDVVGDTLNYSKTTFAPDGSIVGGLPKYK